jgi:hypothetical protein
MSKQERLDQINEAAAVHKAKFRTGIDEAIARWNGKESFSVFPPSGISQDDINAVIAEYTAEGWTFELTHTPRDGSFYYVS